MTFGPDDGAIVYAAAHTACSYAAGSVASGVECRNLDTGAAGWCASDTPCEASPQAATDIRSSELKPAQAGDQIRMADGDVNCRMLEAEIACRGLDGSYISFGPQGVSKVSDQPAWNAGVYTWLSPSVWIHPGETQQRFRAAWPAAECAGDFCGIPAGEPAACPTHDPCFDGGYQFDADGHVRSWMIKTDASTWDARRRELTKEYGAPKKALVGAGLLPTMTYTWEVTTGQIELSHMTGQGLNGPVDDYLIEAKASA